MTNIIDFSSCKLNDRYGRYGGAAGNKDGITYKNENWIIKYPKSTKSMAGDNISYTTAPLSEYIGSQIYQILGYDVHETLLGIRNNKLVVACKDFQPHMGDLAEVRSIKNAAQEQLSALSEEELPESATGDSVNLNELMLHFELNPLLSEPYIQSRFWDCVIVDILIDNNDRNNGNWGLLYGENGERKLAPIYDNGNSFNNKATVEQIKKYMQEPEDKLINRINGSRTAYEYNGHTLSAKKILTLGTNFEELNEAIKRVVPNIEKNLSKMYKLIDSIPDEVGSKQKPIIVCPDAVKEYYKKCLEVRTQHLLIPAYEKMMNQEKVSVTNRTFDENITRAYQQCKENKNLNTQNPTKNNNIDR